jgi:hypothetical protein
MEIEKVLGYSHALSGVDKVVKPLQENTIVE